MQTKDRTQIAFNISINCNESKNNMKNKGEEEEENGI